MIMPKLAWVSSFLVFGTLVPLKKFIIYVALHEKV